MSFTIENNVLIGKNDPDWKEKQSLAKSVLDSLTQYPDSIGRVIKYFLIFLNFDIKELHFWLQFFFRSMQTVEINYHLKK